MSDDEALVKPEARDLAVADVGRSPDAYEKKYMPGEGTVLYRDKARAPWFLHAVMGLGAASILPSLFIAGAWPIGLLSLGVMFVIWILFAVLRVTVSEGAVNVQYGLFGPKIPIAAIESAEATKYKWTKFGGWGIRRSLDGEWIYNMPGDGGNAVRIVWRDAKGRRSVTMVGSRRSQQLADSIAHARKALPPGATADALPPGED